MSGGGKGDALGKAGMGLGAAGLGAAALHESVDGGNVGGFLEAISDFMTNVSEKVGGLLNDAQEKMGLDGSHSLGDFGDNVGLETVGDVAFGGLASALASVYFLTKNGGHDFLGSVGKTAMIGGAFSQSLPIFGAGIAAWGMKRFYDGMSQLGSK